jgi:hypothetical protein
MDSLKYLFSFATLAFLNICYSQTGPGGVGSNDGTSNLVIWYRPDNGVIYSGTDVSGWINSAGYTTLNLVRSGATFPQLVAGSVNGYDEIQFDTNGFLLSATGLNTINYISNQASSFIHLQANSITNSFPYDSRGSSGTRFLCHVPWGDNTVYFDIGTCCGTSARVQVSGLTNLTNYSLWNFDALPATGKQLYRNGAILANVAGSSTFIPQTTSRFSLGNNFNGNITELIVYNTKVNTAQRLIIQNYIAAKYNQNLTSNDLYNQDDPGRGNFDYNVAGIGQAIDGSNHTDSQGTGIVRINNPRALSNNDFLFWGEETRNPTYNFSTNTTNHTEQLNSRWRVRRRGNPGSVDVTFDLSSVDLSGKQSCSPLQLIVDNNYDFSSPEAIYDLTIVGSNATATNVRLNQNRYFTLRYVDEIIRDGSSYYNGSGVANAPDNTNACLKFTVKSGAVSNINTSIHVRSVEVETGGVLNILNGNLLQVDNEVVVNGTINLLGEAQLIQNHTGTTLNSGSGSLTQPQQGSASFYNYNYWSSPVNVGGIWQVGYLEDAAGVINFSNTLNGDASTSPITLSSKWLYSFNGTTDDYSQWIKISPTTNLLPAQGFTMKGSGATTANQEYIFRGIPNDGDYNHTVTAGNDFLTGNPYPSALDADQFIIDNLPVIDGTLYFWEQFSTNNTHTLADYQGGHAIYNLMGMGMPATADASGLTSGLGTASLPAPERYIPVGQGFFVSIQNSGSITFNNGQRVFARESLGESVFFKTNTKKITQEDTRTKIWFSFTKPDTYTKYIGLGYDANASYNYDNGYDALAYDELQNDISWSLNGEALAILALPELNIEDVLPLNVKVSDADFYNFSISKMENVPNDINIFLKDNLQNLYYNLSEGEASLFLNSATAPDQFSIVFQKKNTLGKADFETTNKFYASYDANLKQLKLHTKEAINNIEAYNVFNSLGQQVLQVRSPKTQTITVESLSDGVYILEIAIENLRSPKKIKFIKY